MAIWTSAYKTSKRHSIAAVLQAAVMTAIAPAVAAGLWLWFAPATCNTSVSAAQYRWTCLFPGLLLVVPSAVAILLAIATVLNQRRKRSIPDGWLVTAFAAGIITQTHLVGGYMVAAGPAYAALFLALAILIPQPFIAGALASGVFWLALHWGQPV
jgi:hypothetical protein